MDIVIESLYIEYTGPSVRAVWCRVEYARKAASIFSSQTA